MDDEDVLTFLRRLLTREATSEVADRVVREIQTALGGQQYYISAAPNDRRDEALRLLRAGLAVGEVARRVNVHPATVYRWWRSREQRLAHRESTGLARDKNWTL